MYFSLHLIFSHICCNLFRQTMTMIKAILLGHSKTVLVLILHKKGPSYDFKFACETRFLPTVGLKGSVQADISISIRTQFSMVWLQNRTCTNSVLV